MKLSLALVCLQLSGFATAATFEVDMIKAMDALKMQGVIHGQGALQAPQEPREPVLQDPKLAPLGSKEAPGKVVGSLKLADQIDRHRDLLTRQLGSAPRLVSVAGDAAFKTYFMTFAWAGQLVIAPLGDLNRLRGDGIDIRVDADTAYNFKVSINIFSPVRGSTLKMKAIQGTQGPNHDVKTGVILDAVKARSYVFNAKGKEFWLLAGTDVDPATNRLTDTRSLLFIHEDGTSSKAWPIAESALPAGQASSVAFGDVKLILTRSAEGQLTINEAK